jgi:Domain of unknown function (DUF4440)
MQRLIRCPLLAALLALSSCTFYADHPVKAFGDATGGEGLERAFWSDIQKQDWKDLDRHITSNFVYVTPTGRWERAAALEHIQQLRVEEYSLGDLTTEMNRDAFVVTYTITLRGTAQGQALPDQPQRRMTVWQQQKGGWVAIAHSVLGTEPK